SGKGPAIEMLNCLQITDLAQVTALMFPKPVAFLDAIPPSYQWTENLYERLGEPKAFKKITKLSQWHIGK
ncbi:MAG: hypothetical protein HKN76_18105, partial [Saprospiraceae bacterium]|nr:hypothetical protein [Saprospiraceae bacterium]